MGFPVVRFEINVSGPVEAANVVLGMLCDARGNRIALVRAAPIS